MKKSVTLEDAQEEARRKVMLAMARGYQLVCLCANSAPPFTSKFSSPSALPLATGEGLSFVDAQGAAAADRRLVAAQPAMEAALARTSIAEDEALLAAEEPPPYHEQLALRFRIALKRAAM